MIENSFGHLMDGPSSPLLILAHGAGAPMDSPFMEAMTAALVQVGVGVLRFEFPYMQERREFGKKRPPNPMPQLMNSYLEVIEQVGAGRSVFIGGKSMGGRVATLVGDQVNAGDRAGLTDQSTDSDRTRGRIQSTVSGIVCLGYPFHPKGKPEKLRVDHLETLETPTLILQGTRDPLGDQGEIRGYGLSKRIEVTFLEDGDHDLKPRVKSGYTQQQHIETSANAIRRFIDKHSTG